MNQSPDAGALGAYPRLMNEIGAGSPPPASEVEAEIRRRDEMFRAQKFAKNANDALNVEEETELRAALREARLSKYTEAAQLLKMYASLNAINAPYWNQQDPLSLRQIFDWEWQLWVKQDVLHALHSANQHYESLLHGPVKRIRSLSVSAMPAPSEAGGAAAPAPFGGAAPAAAEASADAVAIPPDPKIEAPRDFQVSYTGRVSNALYDVRRVYLDIVVDTARIPEVLDALAKQNLMTVIDLKMRPTDAHADLADGFVYGTDVTSDLQLTIETIWLREWTANLMPAEVKQALTPPVT
jgi:hypothetical protein